jgi:protein-S-isoprenylcysteine O-methyltransferase Ste14
LHHSLHDLPAAVPWPLAALWMAWLGYWVFAARDVKPVRRQESTASRLLTAALIVPAALLMAAPGGRLPWLGARFLPETMIVHGLGLLLVLAGLAFAVWARAHLRRNWSGTVTIKEDHELVRSGPYALVRRPIYAGLLLAMLGTAIVFGEWRGVAAFCFLSAAFSLKLRREERFMAESFPDTYPRYRAQVPALVPLFRGSDSGTGLC